MPGHALPRVPTGIRARRGVARLAVAALLAAAVGVAVPAGAAAAPPAPGVPGAASTWSPGDKDGFGTARTRASKVWYTLNQGVLSEVFFPRIDTPATRDTQLVSPTAAASPTARTPPPTTGSGCWRAAAWSTARSTRRARAGTASPRPT